MSEFDETDFDEDDINDLLEEEEEGLTPEEVFKMVMINKVKGTTVSVKLFDKEDDEIELSEIIEQLLTFIEKQLSEDGSNQLTDQIIPLMAQALVSGLGRMLGINQTAFYLSNEVTKMSMINMMSISFLLLKFVQQNDITIQTFEEDISEEEMDELQRKAKAQSQATMGAFLGMNPKEILQDLFDRGEITQEDLDSMLNGDDE
jgi:hypothetical protein